MEYQKSLSALLDKVEKKSQENEEQKFIAKEVISELMAESWIIKALL